MAGRRGAARIAGAALIAAATILFGHEVAAEPLCNREAYFVVGWCEAPCTYWEGSPDADKGCGVKQAYYCADGSPWGDKICQWENCLLGYRCEDWATECSDPNIGSSERCGADGSGDGIDNDANGCIDDGCIKGKPPCECVKTCETLACGNVADCEPPHQEEICGDGIDNDCDGLVDEGCEPKLKCTEAEPKDKEDLLASLAGNAGADPIVLSNRSAVTTPFVDFGAEALVRLEFSRIWSSADTSHFGGPVGPFGRGWRHGWDWKLKCEGDFCTVLRASAQGLVFVKGEEALSLDGSETLRLYRPEPGTSSAARGQLLAKHASGGWTLFQSDGWTYTFAPACDACGEGGACLGVESGGVARLVRAADPGGSGFTVTYARPTGLLIGLADDLGHTLELRSDSACLDGLGRELWFDGMKVATYEYQDQNLLRAVDADGAVLRAYSYATYGSGLLLAVLDEAGLPVVEFSYAENGDAIGVTDELSTTTVGYGEDGAAAVTEQAGNGTTTGTRQLDRNGLLTSISGGNACGDARTFVWAGRDLLCTTDSVGVTTYTQRDSLGRIVRRARFQGSACPPPATLPSPAEDETRTFGVARPVAQGVSIELTSVTSVSRPSVLSSSGSASDFWDYSKEGQSFDPPDYSCGPESLKPGAVLCRKIVAGHTSDATGAPVPERHATFYSYDEKGRLVKTIGPINLDRPSPTDVIPVEERLYWPDGETLARRGKLGEIRRYASQGASPLATSFDYDPFGLYRAWAPDGHVTTWVKDGRGRITLVLESDGRRSEIRYHDGDKQRLRISPAGVVERTGYDTRGRPNSEERLSGDPDAAGAYAVLWGTYHTYDPAGNKVHSERRDGTGAVVWQQDRQFDVQHRLVAELHPEVAGKSRSWEFDSAGHLVGARDEEGRSTTFAIDALGRTGSVTRSSAAGQTPPASTRVAGYTYAGASNALLGVTDGANRTTGYQQDDFGQTVKVENAATFKSNGPIRMTYDARGNLLQRVGGGTSESFTYDGLDRQVSIAATRDAGGFPVAATIAYDAPGQAGRLSSITTGSVSTTYGWDAAGRLARESVMTTDGNAPLVTELHRDADGNVASVVYPSGFGVTYARDAVTKEVVAVKETRTSRPFLTGIGRAPQGPITSGTFGNGQPLSQGFNQRFEPASVQSGPMSLLYGMSVGGDVSGIAGGPVSTGFSHDHLSRLTGFAPGTAGAESLMYQYAGDRVIAATTTSNQPRLAFGYDSASNLSGIWAVDAASGLVSKHVCLVHDALGRLALAGLGNPWRAFPFPPGATPPASQPAPPPPMDPPGCQVEGDVTQVIARYGYDTQNRRVSRTDSSGTTWFSFLPSGEPIGEYRLVGGSWQPVREYVWLEGRPVAQEEHPSASERYTYFIHVDHIGLPRALTNQSGHEVWRATARPYGDIDETSYTDPVSGRAVATNLRLPGQYDERLFAAAGVSGLPGPYYNWNRWYLPSLGRYLELDPIAADGDFNSDYAHEWFAYADADPLRFTDDDGLSRTEGLRGNDPAQKELKDAAKKGRQCVDSVAKKWEQLRRDGVIGADRWRWIKGWIKVAKRGGFGFFPLLNVTPLCQPNSSCFQDSPILGYPKEI
jgi:RHS repeat-associated protein